MRISVLSLCLLIGMSCAHAQTKKFSCQIEVSKGSCWHAQEVTVKINSSSWEDIVTSLKLSKKEFFTKKEISCNPADNLTAVATFLPPIWENDAGVVYKQKTQWHVPSILPEGSDNYVVQICFPKDFTGVPIPLGAVRKCECDFSAK